MIAHMVKTSLYNVWVNMRQRCKGNSSQSDRALYKDRGIRVCRKWKNYKSFRRWAINSGYRIGLILDRKNNDLGYSPQNCRWVNTNQSCQNRRKYHFVDGRKTASKYKGVNFSKRHKNKPWKAVISVNKVRLFLGYFQSQRAAAKAYDKAAKKFFGEHACLNFQRRAKV